MGGCIGDNDSELSASEGEVEGCVVEGACEYVGGSVVGSTVGNGCSHSHMFS